MYTLATIRNNDLGFLETRSPDRFWGRTTLSKAHVTTLVRWKEQGRAKCLASVDIDLTIGILPRGCPSMWRLTQRLRFSQYFNSLACLRTKVIVSNLCSFSRKRIFASLSFSLGEWDVTWQLVNDIQSINRSSYISSDHRNCLKIKL